MSLEIGVTPDGANVLMIPERSPEEGEAAEDVPQTRMLQFFDEQSGIKVTIGPFPSEGWEEYRAYLNDPQGEAAKQAARSKIAVASAVPAMSVPKG